jgi:hypothetical protein
MQDQPIGPNPTGLCMCGCGRAAPIADRNRPEQGHVKGQPTYFLRGHTPQQRRLSDPTRRYLVEDCGYETACWMWQGPTSQGYARVGIDGSRKLVHRLEWEKRHGAVPDGMQLHHLCEIKRCVNPDHLQLMTAAEHTRIGPLTKLTPDDVQEIRRLLAEGSSNRQVARMYGLDRSTVSNIRTRKLWAHLP